MKCLPCAGLIGLASLGAHAQVIPPLAPKALEPILVTATRMPGSETATLRDSIVVTRDELESYGTLSLAEVLQLRAGVEIRATGGAGQPTGIFMRGAGAAQTLVLVDGLRVGSATAGTTAIEAIPLELIERIEVVKGAMSSLYGSEAIGGVVQIFTRGKSVPHLFVTGSYGTDQDRRGSAGLATADAKTQFSLSLGARKVEADSATNPRVPFGVHDPDRDPHENAFASAKVSQVLWQGEKLTLEGFGSKSRTYFDGGSPADRSEQRVAGGRITSANTFLRGWKSHLSVGHGRDELRIAGSFPSRFQTRQDQATWLNELTGRDGSLMIGAETVRQKVVPQRDEALEISFDCNRRDTDSVFAAINQKIRAQQLEASYRHDRDDQFGSRDTGSVSSSVPLTRGGTQLVVTWGRGFRAPTFNDLYLRLPFYEPNPNLRPERSRNIEVSLRGSWLPVTRWRITAFENRLEDLIVYSFEANTVLNVNRARVRGVEAMADAKWLGIDWRASVTVQQPKDLATGARLQSRAKHFGSLEAGRSWAGKWYTGISVLASGDRFDSINEAPSSRLGSYGRVDARIRYDVSKLWKAELSAVNLTDKRYETALGYDAPRRGVLLTIRMDAF